MTDVSTCTFSADGLLFKSGFGDGDIPDDVMDGQFDRRPHGEVVLGLPGNWHDDVLVPVARDLLVPALPVPVVLAAMSSSHNPARVTQVNGEPFDTYSDPRRDEVEALFRPVEVTFPVPYLVDVLEGDRSFANLARLSGMDLGLLTVAFAAGVSVDEIADLLVGVDPQMVAAAFVAGLSVHEIADLHAAGSLDGDVLTAMAALRG